MPALGLSLGCLAVVESTMADVMIAVMPFHGHVAPMAAVAEAFIEAGHAVRVYTGSAHASRFAALGAGVVPWRTAPDFDEHDLASTFPELRGRKGPRQMLANVEHVFIGTSAGQHDDLMAAFAERQWDVIVADGLSLGACLASESAGSPWVTVSIVPLAIPSRDLPPPMLAIPPATGWLGRLRDRVLRRILALATGGMRRAYVTQRRAAGLPEGSRHFDEAWYSPDLVCATGVSDLEYPRSDLPTHVEFVGSLTVQRGRRPSRPEWWPRLDEFDELVHVTQGTLNVDPTDLIAPTLEALGRQRVAVVAATGRRGASELPFPTPPNTFVTDLLDYDELLPRVDVMITNGGWGGVLAALSHGIPLIVAGGDIDKPEIAARVAWAGAGINLGTGRPRARAVLDAWRRIGADPGFRAAAGRLGEELRRHDGPHEVVEHTMRLVAADS